jgi:catechol 2,3-dioxygenase-like lactoylglutathione lyase family enzyme
MSGTRLEHVNVNVSDPERTARLLEGLFDWRVRWSGPSRDGGRTIHVGTADDYVAIHTARDAVYGPQTFAKGQPFNHIGIEVDDLAAIEAKVVAAGLKPFGHDDYDPGKRFYFLDPDGIEYEVVSYRAT